MASRGVEIARGVSVERVGDEVVAYLSTSQEIVRLSGDAALVLESIGQGATVTGGAALVDDLVDRGVLEEKGPSRRNLLTAGAVGAGAGIAVLAMPGVAAASSVINVLGNYYVYDADFDNEELRFVEFLIPGERDVAVDFPEGQGNPSALTISGFPGVPLLPTSVITQFGPDADLTSNNYDRATWRIDIRGIPALVAIYGDYEEIPPTSADTLIAIFTWGASTYRASLAYFVPAPL